MPMRPASERAALTARISVIIMLMASIFDVVRVTRPATSWRYWPTCALSMFRDDMKRAKR